MGREQRFYRRGTGDPERLSHNGTLCVHIEVGGALMAKGTLHLNVEFSAVADEEGKFGRLAKLLGLADADHARGKCEHLWVACTRRGESDLPQWLVEQVLGEHGPGALKESGLASWAGGRGDSKTRRMRIGGAQKHCLWMVGDQEAKTEQRRKGGKTRADEASRQLDGKFAPAGDQHPAEHPAQSSSSEISTATEGEEDPRPAVASPTPGQTELPGSAAARPASRSRKPSKPTETERAIALAVLAKLGARNGTRYSGTDAHVELITGRLREGYSEHDLVAIAAERELAWRDKPEMRQYLTPETLWGPRKIQQYIDAARTRFPAVARPARIEAVSDEPWLGGFSAAVTG